MGAYIYNGPNINKEIYYHQDVETKIINIKFKKKGFQRNYFYFFNKKITKLLYK